MAYVLDDYGHLYDLYETPELVHQPLPANNQLDVSLPKNSDEGSTDSNSSKFDFDEDSRIKALVNTSSLDWQQPSSSGCFASGGRIFGGGCGFGRSNGFQSRKPPEGYVCHRCKTAGHFIQHCPTNGDPNYDFKKIKVPTGIPKSMLVPDSDGLYKLPGGDAAVLRPDEVAFEREIEGMPCTRTVVGDIPKELYCQLCKQIMKFAMLSGKCCFQSFCDECIRNFIITKSMCVCGAKNILADDLLPNLTLRKTINRLMESNDGSGVENDVTALHVQDMGSTNLHSKAPSPVQSVVASDGITHKPIGSKKRETPESMIWADKKERMNGIDGVTNESIGVKNPTSQGRSVFLADKESEAGKKKKRNKVQIPLDAAEMQRNAAQNLAAQNYMMPMAFSAYNPYWNLTTGIQSGMEGFLTPYAGAFPYTGPEVSAFGMPFGAMLPQDHFAGAPSVNRIREEFETGKKSVSKRKYEAADRTESLKNQELDSEICTGSDISSTKSKSIFPKRSSSHHSKTSFPDCQEHDSYNHEQPRRKQQRRHGDEHYHYQDERHYHHYREHRHSSKHYH